MTLPDRIRQAIATDHTAIEDTPFARAMTMGAIDRDAYADGLRELYHLHAAVEAALGIAAAECREVAALFHPGHMTRSTLIAADLVALGSLPAVEPGAAVAAFAGELAGWAADRPWALLGPLYVLEGSRMGSMVLVRSLAPALRVDRRPGAGLDYHLDGIPTRPQEWQRFRAALAAAPLTDEQQADALAAAVATMRTLVALYAGLPAGAAAPAAVA
ncbi:biliverdin-producing heme oxygenase [Gemmata sp.]|uniref:biliverdin-producing heme oxygenase n=1 Tax=Gemmata sp. TaxID=1914242 RepID=UPI003F70F89B